MKPIAFMPESEARRADETLPCAHCKTPIQVPASTIEFAAAMNRIRATQGIPLVRKSDGIPLCPPCYEKHRTTLRLQAQIKQEHDDDLWRRYLAKEINEDRLLAGVHDQERFRQLLARVKAQPRPKRETE